MNLSLVLFTLLCAALSHNSLLVAAQNRRKSSFFLCAPRFVVTRPRNCPCFLRARISRLPQLDLRLYLVPETDFVEWISEFRAAQQSGRRIPAINNSTGQWKAVPLLAARRRIESVWISGAQQVNSEGSFVLALIADGSGCGSGQLVLEKRPDVCPLRLADRSSVLARNGVSKFVVGGTKVSENDEFNGYNALVTTTKGNCTGTVISNQWILTAAHCEVLPGAYVSIGGTSLSNGQKYIVDASIRHQDYVGQEAILGRARIVNDIAVLKLSTLIQNPQIIQLNSNPNGPDPGTIVRATGYGLQSTVFPSNFLRMVDIPLLSTEECRNRFSSTGKSFVARGLERQYHLCSGRDSNCKSGGVCFGDSGGPVVARIPDGSLVQVGVTSFGDATCANSNSADVFTRVSSYIDWIQDATGGAATTAEWQSVNNVASSGEFGTESGGRSPLPLWGIVSIAIGAGVAAVALTIICVLLIGRGRNQGDNSDEENSDAEQPQNPNQGSPARRISSPPPAVLLPSSPIPSAPPPPPPEMSMPQPSAPIPPPPPSPLIAYPNNSPSAPPPPLAEYPGGTLGHRPIQ